MFVRPDWKDIKAYGESETLSLHGVIAWEFIRRNPDYQKDVDLYHAEVVAFFSEFKGQFFGDEAPTNSEFSFSAMQAPFMILQSTRYSYWKKLFEEKWGLAGPAMTELPYMGGFSFPPVDDPESFERESWSDGVKGPRVLVPVDLSEPLEIMLEKAEIEIRRMRNEGIKSGVVKPVTSRVLTTAVYVEYLRILDGIAAGETIQKIGEVLSPSAVNTPEEKQRDKRIRAAYKAALKMQEGGYRVLIY